jgi:hypothetical protein
MKPKTDILIKYSELVGRYPLKKIFDYLNTLQKTGMTNMLGATPYLYGGREWIQKQIDYFDIEEDENIEKLLDTADNIRDVIIAGALKKSEKEKSNDLIRSVERRIKIEASDILKIWMDFKGKVIKESFSNRIKKILKEESDRKSKILSMIKNQGFILTTRAVGGINHLASILEETPEMLLTKYLSKETFSTDDIEKNTGGYNFKFKLLFVKKSERYSAEHNFVFSIEEGTVDLIMGDDVTYDLLGDDIREYDMWWEIKYEIQDTLSDFVEELTNKLKFDEVKSINVNFIFKGRDQFNYINEEEEKTNHSKLENRVKKMIDTLTKDIEFPENFYDFMVDVIEDKKYNENILKITTVMKKPFSQEDSDEIDEVKRDVVRQIKSFFKGMFDRISGGGTSTLEFYNKDKERDLDF